MARTTAVYLFTVHFLSYIIVCRQDSGNNKPRDQSTVSESSRRFRTEFLEDWPQAPGAPYFDPSTPDNVTGLVGHPVTLLCKVKNLQNRTVSWVRHRDIHLLTVGRYTYTSDQRFEAQHKPRSEEWALRIRSPQRRDSGQYECQISTTPPIGHAVFLNIVGKIYYKPRSEEWALRIRSPQRRDSGQYECQISTTPPIGHAVFLNIVGKIYYKPRSEEWALRIRSPQRRDSGQYECQISTTPPIGHAVFLNIVEPETEILGGPDLFIYAGSTINLTCIVKHTPEPPNTINWTHRGKTINFDSTRGGISLVTEKGTHSSSRLLVQSARTSDAGAYQCAPDNALTASARVHVLTGETPAAMQGSAQWPSRLRLPIIVFISVSLFKVTV